MDFKVNFVVQIQNFTMVPRDFLHFCTQRNSESTLAIVTMAFLQNFWNGTSIKVFGPKVCWVRDNSNFCDFDFAVLCEFLNRQRWCGIVFILPTTLRTAMPQSAGAPIRTSSTVCPMLLFSLTGTPRSLSIEIAPGPADVPFTRAQKSDSPELKRNYR